MARALTTVEVNQRLAPRGLQLVGEWQGVTSQNTFLCQCGHQWTTWGQSVVVRKSGCLACFRRSDKLSKEIVNAKLADRGITLVGEWLGMHKSHTFRCEQGHTWQANGQGPVMHGSSCPTCYNQDSFLSFDEVAAKLPNGISLVGPWKGANKLNHFICEKEHEWETIGKGPLKGTGCPVCYVENKKLTTKQVNLRLQGFGLRLIGKWRGVKYLHRFSCNLGHVWEVTGNGPLKGSGCPHCASNAMLTLAQVHQRLQPQEITLLGEWKGGRRRYNFFCKNGHKWRTRGVSVLRGSGCPFCNGTGFPKLTMAEVSQRLKLNGLALVGAWNGKAKSNRFRCQLGHEWETSGAGPTALTHPTGCPECSRLQRKNKLAFN